jgi:hypothetical protein
MPKRYGAGELYGLDFSGLTRQCIRDLSTVSHREMECPFKPLISGKPKLKCNKKSGVCSLRQFELMSGKLCQACGPLVTTCPSRFLENAVVSCWVGEILLGTKNPISISELPFLMGEVQEENEAQDAVGKIDQVLVHIESSALKWCALEMQAVYFSGKSMENDFRIMRTWQRN